MTKRITTKYKIDRRLRVNLWGRAKSPFNSRPYRPGEHGQAPYKLSDYGVQMFAKQKLKGYYGNITERQFKKYYNQAVQNKGDTSENLIGLLERRLDAVIYRMKLVPTVFAARQVVSHGHIKINGRRTNTPSYLVKEGDEIEVANSSKNMATFMEASALTERDVPAYVHIDSKTLKGKFLNIPKFADVPYPTRMEPNVVVEFYSR